MAEQTVDQILDGGASCLQYFKAMLDIAKWLSNKTWPDWRDHVCRNYDNERGIDLASLRGDAVMLRQQATAARQAATDQSAARTSVQTAWPDNAGRAAVTTLDAHQKRSDPMATTLEKVATAAEAIPDAIVSAVRAKTDGLREFESKEVDAGVWAGVMKVAGAVVPGLASVVELNAGSRERFEAQLAQDLARFDQVVATAVASVRAAYATVPAAAKGIDSSAFPAPSFGTITATSPTSPGGGNPVATPVGVGGGNGGGGTGGGGTGGGNSGGGTTSGGSPTSSTPTTATPTSLSPTTTNPTTTSPSMTPTATSPTSTSPAATTPSAGTPSGATPSAGKDTGSSWLSQLLPKIAEQFGLGDKTASDGKGGDAKDSKDGKAGEDKAGKDTDKDAKGEKVLGTDALGRTVTATLSPDGKTVEVTAKKPDGTVEKATLTIGEDGKLTPVATTGETAAGQGDTKPGDTKPGETKPGETKPGETMPGESKPDGTTAPAGATPSAAAPDSAGAGAGATAAGSGAGPAATPSGAAPSGAAAVIPPPVQGSSDSGGRTGAPAPAPAQGEEPCPPEPSGDQPAESGTGADFATSAP